MNQTNNGVKRASKGMNKKTWIIIGITLSYAGLLLAFPHASFAAELKSSINKGSGDVTGLIKSIFPGVAGVSFGIIGLAFFGPRKLKEWAKDHILSTIAGIAFILLAAGTVSFFTSTFGG